MSIHLEGAEPGLELGASVSKVHVHAVNHKPHCPLPPAVIPFSRASRRLLKGSKSDLEKNLQCGAHTHALCHTSL